MVWQLLITLALAGLGTFLGLKFKVPGGGIIGAIALVGAYQIITGNAYFPTEVRAVTTSLVGTYLGARVSRADLKELHKLALPAVAMVIVMMGFNVGTSYLLTKVTGIDFASAMLATAPGGMTEMALVAMDMGANSSIVTMVQLIRLVAVLLTVPTLLRFVIPRLKDRHDVAAADASAEHPEKVKVEHNYKHLLITLAIGIPLGVLGKISGVPSGALLFSMVSVAAFNIITGKAYMPIGLRYVAQSCNGALTGTRFLVTDFALISGAIGPIMILVVGWILLGFAIGWAFNRFFKMQYKTALFATAAGGMNDMGLIAAEYGGDTTQITVLQLCRVLSVVMFYPTLTHLIVG